MPRFSPASPTTQGPTTKNIALGEVLPREGVKPQVEVIRDRSSMAKSHATLMAGRRRRKLSAGLRTCKKPRPPFNPENPLSPPYPTITLLQVSDLNHHYQIHRRPHPPKPRPPPNLDQPRPNRPHAPHHRQRTRRLPLRHQHQRRHQTPRPRRGNSSPAPFKHHRLPRLRLGHRSHRSRRRHNHNSILHPFRHPAHSSRKHRPCEFPLVKKLRPCRYR